MSPTDTVQAKNTDAMSESELRNEVRRLRLHVAQLKARVKREKKARGEMLTEAQASLRELRNVVKMFAEGKKPQ